MPEAQLVADEELLGEVESLVKHWLLEAAEMPTTAAARRLAVLLKDPAGLDFTVGFIDGVVRPEDPTIAASNLRQLAATTPRSLPRPLRAAIGLGARLSTLAPGIVIRIARRALRRMVGHLLVDATDVKLGRVITKLRKRGASLNINLLGEAVLGSAEAARRLDGTRRLLERPDVDYVSLKVSAAVAPHSPWAFDEAVSHIEESLFPLYAFAAASPTPKFINLDMEEYRDLQLTIAVFKRLLDRPELCDLEAGIVLQAYLPDAFAAMIQLQGWAAARRARGGAAIKVRLVKGANLPMERVETSLHGWPLATWSTKQDTDTNYKRVLDYALTPDRLQNIRLGIAGHNLFDIAYAWVLAGRREARHLIDFEMLLGMAEGQAEAVRRTVGGLLLYVPAVEPQDFDVAIAYLVRRLEEGASQENFMSAVFELHDNVSLYERERNRFAASLANVDDRIPQPNRRQDRRTDDPYAVVNGPGRFANAPDTDPSLEGNREWARAIIDRVPSSTIGIDLVNAHTVSDATALDRRISEAVSASEAWGARSGSERADVLRRAAGALEERRAELLEVMAAECGKTLDQGDPEVSEAIDFANYYAYLAEQLDQIDGAEPVPARLVVVSPPWNFPVAISAGSTLAGLAAGASVVLKPAPQARRCGSVMAQALWAAGVPEDVLQLVHLDEGDLGRQLVADPRVDRHILTGSLDTARLFRSFRPDLALLAETSGKNAMVITPHADLDLAVKDLVSSAFGHAGQKCSAASLGILVGSVARSRRFRDQLVDAVTSLVVDHPSNPSAQVGPIIESPTGKLKSALTRLGPGEAWLVEPRQLDDSGQLWSPGVRTGVRRGSEFHLTEYFGPVLGLIEAETLAEALEIQNQVDYGLTAGLHSLDSDEVELWLSRVEAGNAYVNRSTVGAIVRRQPFGGWKKSAVGAGAKAGGPNYLIGLSAWRSTPATTAAEVSPPVRALIDGARDLALDSGDLAFLERSAGSDAAAWSDEFGPARDVSQLAAEHNVLRYVPTPVTIRIEAAEPADLLRVVAAGIVAHASITVSSAKPLDASLRNLMAGCGVEYELQDEALWEEVLATDAPERVRLLGGNRLAFARASGGSTDVALYAEPVLEAGRIELLTFLREQSIAVTAHRLGSPTHLVDGSAQLFGAQGGAPHHPHHSGDAVASLSQENLVLGRSTGDPSTSRSTFSL